MCMLFYSAQFFVHLNLSNIDRFLPREAMLSAVYAVIVCVCVCVLCVCHTPVLYQKD